MCSFLRVLCFGGTRWELEDRGLARFICKQNGMLEEQFRKKTDMLGMAIEKDRMGVEIRPCLLGKDGITQKSQE